MSKHAFKKIQYGRRFPAGKGSCMNRFQVRQGDVIVEEVGVRRPKIGAQVKRDKGRTVLAYGEVTGHAHAISEFGAELFEIDGLEDRFLRVLEEGGIRDNGRIADQMMHSASDAAYVASIAAVDVEMGTALMTRNLKHLQRAVTSFVGRFLTHEEHAPVPIPPGEYITRRQREYTPEAIRNVAD